MNYKIKTGNLILLQGGEGVFKTWQHMNGSLDNDQKDYLEKYVLKGTFTDAGVEPVTKQDTLMLCDDNDHIIDMIDLTKIYPFSGYTTVELLDMGHTIRIESDNHNVELFRATVSGHDVYGAQILPHYEEGDTETIYFERDKLDDFITDLV